MTDCPHDVMAAFLFPSGKQGGSHDILYDLASEITVCHFYNILLATQVYYPFQCGRRLHKGVDTRKWESRGTILKAGYHMVLVKEESLIHN